MIELAEVEVTPQKTIGKGKTSENCSFHASVFDAAYQSHVFALIIGESILSGN